MRPATGIYYGGRRVLRLPRLGAPGCWRQAALAFVAGVIACALTGLAR